MITAMPYLLGRARARAAALLIAAAAIALAPAAGAAVSPEEAERLGRDLTPLGGERAASADGRIPEWTGGLKSPADAGFPDFRPGGHLQDPYALDKPLFVITAADVDA